MEENLAKKQSRFRYIIDIDKLAVLDVNKLKPVFVDLKKIR